MTVPQASLTTGDLEGIELRLQTTDRLLETVYPGDDGARQPVHSVYVPANVYSPELPTNWGAAATGAANAAGGIEALALRLGIAPQFAALIAPRVERKLDSEPIEDLRLDFEDGYGDRGDETEDVDAVRAAELVADAIIGGVAPPFIGIRFKSFEAPTRARGLRTLDLFVSTLVSRGELPAGLVLTLPKVSTVAQVEAMADATAALERVHSLPPGRLRFEVQIETPQIILGADGRSAVAQIPLAAPGRVSALHYGTYDYSASLLIAPAYQSMEHPAADLAKGIMQLAVAGTGIRLSDGSTNIIPVGDRADDAWALHARLVRRSLERGFYQGWDLHAHQLVTRFVANYAFFLEGYSQAATRLRAYMDRIPGAVLDEPATARALASFLLRAVRCGAVPNTDAARDTGMDAAALSGLANPKSRGIAG